MTNENPMASARVLLPAGCTLKEAGEARALLLAGLEATGDVELDASAVGQIDTSVMQLLACFIRDMRESGRGTIWIGTSGEFDRAASRLGMNDVLGRIS